jgi:hypothetical protein
VSHHSGSEVVAALKERNMAARINSLLAVEKALAGEADYGVVIAPACVVLELVVGQLLGSVGDRTSGQLVDALAAAGRKSQAKLLEKWIVGQLPMTMGLQVTLLAAIEKALAGPSGIDVAQEFGGTNHYRMLLTLGRLPMLLELVRTEYRNPACHGARTFDQAEYAEFARLLLTRSGFREWYRRGPAEIDAGLLDLHLLEWRNRVAR